MATNEEYQALIDSLSGECERLHKENEELKALSQEPTDENLHREREQAYMQGYEDASKRFRQEPCDDAISRDAVLEWCGDINMDVYTNEVKEFVNQLPSVTQKSGKWIEHPEIETSTPEYLMFYECSECGDKQCFYKSDIHKKRFCTNCGAKMVEPQESEDKE